MTLVVEDGTGVLDAEAYANVAFADDYFADRGNTAWAALSTSNKEINLRKGADYMGYNFEYRGIRQYAGQGLDFPRINLYDDRGALLTGVPTNVKKANCELAFIASSIDLLVSTESRRVIMESKSLGDLKRSFQYANTRDIKTFPVVESLLARYTTSNRSGGMKSVRMVPS